MPGAIAWVGRAPRPSAWSRAVRALSVGLLSRKPLPAKLTTDPLGRAARCNPGEGAPGQAGVRPYQDLQVLDRGILGRAVANAADAGHEHHHGGHAPRHLGGVM